MEDLVIVRGGGDIATGTIYKLVKSGFHVLILEIAHPSAIRRNVAFSEAVYEEKCIRYSNPKQRVVNRFSRPNQPYPEAWFFQPSRRSP